MTAAVTEPVSYPSGPSEHGLDLPHWEGLERGDLLVQRCADCATWLWGPRAICASCHSFDLRWEQAPTRGRVFTWCRTQYPYVTELAGLIPYVTVVAEIPGAGDVRLLGMLSGADDVAIGDEVEAVIERPAGARWPVLRWRPVAADQGPHMDGAHE